MTPCLFLHTLITLKYSPSLQPCELRCYTSPIDVIPFYFDLSKAFDSHHHSDTIRHDRLCPAVIVNLVSQSFYDPR